MARLKAGLPCLTSGSAGIVKLNPSEAYVKPFSQILNTIEVMFSKIHDCCKGVYCIIRGLTCNYLPLGTHASKHFLHGSSFQDRKLKDY